MRVPLSLALRRFNLSNCIGSPASQGRRAVSALSDREERINIELDPANLRFMVMAPVGENRQGRG